MFVDTCIISYSLNENFYINQYHNIHISHFNITCYVQIKADQPVHTPHPIPGPSTVAEMAAVRAQHLHLFPGTYVRTCYIPYATVGVYKSEILIYLSIYLSSFLPSYLSSSLPTYLLSSFLFPLPISPSHTLDQNSRFSLF